MFSVVVFGRCGAYVNGGRSARGASVGNLRSLCERSWAVLGGKLGQTQSGKSIWRR